MYTASRTQNKALAPGENDSRGYSWFSDYGVIQGWDTAYESTLVQDRGRLGIRTAMGLGLGWD